ncbi:L-lactate transporter [subsurface metagenome]
MNGENSYLIENRKPKFFYGYVVVLATFCVMVMTGGAWVTFGVFFEPMLTEFGWTRALLSGAVSLRVFLATLLSIAGGRLTDKFGPRPVVTVCGLFLGLGFFLMSRINTIWQLYLVFGVITGVGMAGLWVPMISTISRWFVKRRGMMTGIALSGTSLGMITMPPLATWLIITYGWRTSYTIVGLIAMIVIISATQFVKRDPAQIGQLPDGENRVKAESSDLPARSLSLREAIHTRQFWTLCAVFGCLWFSAMAIWVHIVIHAIDLGIPAISAANILAIMGGAGIAGRILIGSAADRIGYKPALLIGFTLMSASFLWLLVTKELWALNLFAVIFGFGIAGVAVLESPLTARLFGLGSLSVIMGSVEFVSTVLSTPSSIVAGYIFDIRDSYQLAFLICVGVSIIGLMLSLLLRPINNK